MVTEQGYLAGKARERSFCTIVSKEGVIKRGALIAMMNCSHDAFSREYMDYLDAFPNIKYDRKTREFSFSK
tara:strand:- start:102 stop:314 length:213 start_codon:yes stop_codon:yes gene_type:complete